MWKCLYAACIALLATTDLFCQDTTQLKWDLQTCLDHARKNNIQINTLRLEQRLSEQDRLLARASRLPDLSATVTQSVINSSNTDPVVGGFQTQANYSANYSVNSGITVFSGGFINKDIEQRTLLVQSAGLSVQEAQNDVTLQVTQAYLDILLAKENIVNLREIVTTSQAQLELSRQRFRAGSIARRDFLQLEAQLASDQYNLVTAQNNYRQNVIILKQILQLPSSVTFDVVEPDTLVVEQPIPALQTAVSAAMETRPEMHNALLGIEIAEMDLAKARAGFWPTVTVGGSLSSGYSDNREEKYFPQLSNNFFQRIGVTLGIPIFSNRINRTNVERARIGIDQARLSLQDTRTTLDLAIEQAYVNVVNAQAQFRAAEVQWNANREAYRITNEELRLGAINTFDLLQQKNLYVQALQAYIQAKYNAVLNLKIYHFYTGVPVTLP